MGYATDISEKMKSKISFEKLKMFNTPHKLWVGLCLLYANLKHHRRLRPKKNIRRVALYYRICEKGYLKEKPEYITKENCLVNALKEFPLDRVEWHVLADNISEKTYNMIQKYVPAEIIKRVSVGHGAGTFRMVFEEALLQEDDVLVYFLEDDYLHVPGSLDYLREAAECNYTDYLTLYDHPDKYTNQNNPYVTCEGEPSIVYWCGHRHWKETNSTTMTFAAFAEVLKKDKKRFWNWTEGRHPWDFVLFTDLIKTGGRRLSSPIPSCSTHGETQFLARGVDWEAI